MYTNLLSGAENKLGKAPWTWRLGDGFTWKGGFACVELKVQGSLCVRKASSSTCISPF